MPRVTRPDEPQGVKAILPLAQSKAGGSGSFLVRADNHRRYWCKTLNNPQDRRVPINEEIVARLGRVAGIAVCEPMLVYMPQDLVGWEFRPGHAVEEGWAHGKLAVEACIEVYDLQRRDADDNARRHAGFYALYDWAHGSTDHQWLMAGSDSVFYSHDHGHYFPGGPGWTLDSLQLATGAAHELPYPTNGLDSDELSRLADRIEGVAEEEVATVFANIPADWPVTDAELERALDFLLERREAVAHRLRAIIGV